MKRGTGLKKGIKSILNRLPYVAALYDENQLYRKNACYPPGHYYSPVVSVEEITCDRERIWNTDTLNIPGIDLRTKEQIRLLEEFAGYYSDIPFGDEAEGKLRYFFRNGYYSYTDGLILYSFMRHFSPRRIIEAGSGFSSALMLDINELFFKNSSSLTFIEPYPDRLLSLMREEDKDCGTVIRKRVQEVPLSTFSELSENDILFIDSSHVCKTGSDVNFILFEILPLLKKGVIIHFHDIFFPFEYPEEWVTGGRNWNEVYLIKALLTGNKAYEIMFFSHYMHLRYPEAYMKMPLAYKDKGCNFWLRKVNE